MAEFAELRALPQPRRAAELTPEAKHYKAFKPLWKQKENSRVEDIAFSPVSPHRVAVASGTRVQLYQKDKEGEASVFAQVSKFKDHTQCVSWRSDGKLLLGGDVTGTCSLVEIEGHSVLRRFRNHGDAVTCAAFASSDRSRCATGSRDGRLRIWDVATSELLLTVDAHTDCLKVIAAGPGGPDGWITAGYDGKVKLWDLRSGLASADDTTAKSAVASGCVVAVDHGSPIEAGVAFPGGALFASAGGSEVKIWDLASGGRLVQSLPDAHSKAITALSLDSSAAVLLTASFDGLAKVYRAATLEHLWTYRLPGPATCASWRADGKAFVVGLDDGQWQLREFQGAAKKKGRPDPPVQVLTKLKRQRQNGMDSAPNADDEVVEPDRKAKMREEAVDFFFRKFEYRKVVETLSLPSTPTSFGLAVIDELLQRGALAKSLFELGEELCLKVLQWLMKAFGDGDALQQQLLMEALHTLLDCNKCLQPPCTPELVQAVTKLETKLMQQLCSHQVLMETAGMLKTVTAS